jgi:hypothetical protein
MKEARRLYAGLCLLVVSCSAAQASDPLAEWDIAARPQIGFRGLAYKDQRFVGVGFGTNIVVSTNGVDWAGVPINLPQYVGAMDVTVGNGQFVAVGPNGNILTSGDGLQWTRRRVTGPPYEEFWGVTWGHAGFVAVGLAWSGNPFTTVIAISPDGVAWEKLALVTARTPRNIAYGNGVYLAAAPEGSMYSTNARDWTFLETVRAESIAFGGGQFVTALGRSGHISSNGVDWTAVTLPMLNESPENNYYTGFYANGIFMFAGFCGGCPNSERPSLMATSTDAINWTLRRFGTNVVSAIRDIVFVDGQFYAGDEGGRIWRSGRMTPTSPPAIRHVARANGQTDLTFTTVAGFHYQVSCADTLDSSFWTACRQGLWATGNQLTVTDSNATTGTRFYRVRAE